MICERLDPAGEDWNYVMYDGVRATSMLSVMYFVITIVVGNYLVLNLFVAILLANFAAGDSNLEKERAREAENLEEQSQELVCLVLSFDSGYFYWCL